MVSPNPFIHLLKQFKKTHKKYLWYQLWFGAFTLDELGEYHFLRESLVCTVPTRKSSWYIVAEFHHPLWRYKSEEDRSYELVRLVDEFYELAGQAGAALPLSIRRNIPGYPHNVPTEPVSWWVTFLWHLFPPSEEDLAPLIGQSPPVRLAFSVPFQRSIDAIELCKLHTDEQSFPPENWPVTIAPIELEPMTIGLTVPQDSPPDEDKNNSLHPDGMEGGRWLWWENERHDITRGTVYRLLHHMWDRESASYDGLLESEVFESDVLPQTIRSFVNKANNALPTGFPWKLSADSINRHLTKIVKDNGKLRVSPRIPK